MSLRGFLLIQQQECDVIYLYGRYFCFPDQTALESLGQSAGLPVGPEEGDSPVMLGAHNIVKVE